MIEQTLDIPTKDGATTTFVCHPERGGPHLTAGRTTAETYFACAETDHWAPPEMVKALAGHLAASGASSEVEVYPGVDHGFAFPGRAAYDKMAAERHWERLIALFRRRLG